MTLNIFENNMSLSSGLLVAVGGSQSGKSTLLKPYEKRGFKKVSFADPLRELTWVLIGYKPADYEKFKRCVVGLDMFPVEFSEALIKAFPLILTGRKILQYIGDGMRRIFGDDFWVDQCFKRLLELLMNEESAYIDDCRYPNEIERCYELIQKYNGLIIFANYGSGLQCPDDPHVSELMSQILRQIGLNHGDIINREHIDTMKVLYTKEITRRYMLNK